jgi:hypothetical protein
MSEGFGNKFDRMSEGLGQKFDRVSEILEKYLKKQAG